MEFITDWTVLSKVVGAGLVLGAGVITAAVSPFVASKHWNDKKDIHHEFEEEFKNIAGQDAEKIIEFIINLENKRARNWWIRFNKPIYNTNVKVYCERGITKVFGQPKIYIVTACEIKKNKPIFHEEPDIYTYTRIPIHDISLSVSEDEPYHEPRAAFYKICNDIIAKADVLGQSEHANLIECKRFLSELEDIDSRYRTRYNTKFSQFMDKLILVAQQFNVNMKTEFADAFLNSKKLLGKSSKWEDTLHHRRMYERASRLVKKTFNIICVDGIHYVQYAGFRMDMFMESGDPNTELQTFLHHTRLEYRTTDDIETNVKITIRPAGDISHAVPVVSQPRPGAPQPVPGAPQPVPGAPQPVPGAPRSVPGAVPGAVPVVSHAVPGAPQPRLGAPQPAPSLPEVDNTVGLLCIMFEHARQTREDENKYTLEFDLKAAANTRKKVTITWEMDPTFKDDPVAFSHPLMIRSASLVTEDSHGVLYNKISKFMDVINNPGEIKPPKDCKMLSIDELFKDGANIFDFNKESERKDACKLAYGHESTGFIITLNKRIHSIRKFKDAGVDVVDFSNEKTSWKLRFNGALSKDRNPHKIWVRPPTTFHFISSVGPTFITKMAKKYEIAGVSIPSNTQTFKDIKNIEPVFYPSKSAARFKDKDINEQFIAIKTHNTAMKYIVCVRHFDKYRRADAYYRIKYTEMRDKSAATRRKNTGSMAKGKRYLILYGSIMGKLQAYEDGWGRRLHSKVAWNDRWVRTVQISNNVAVRNAGAEGAVSTTFSFEHIEKRADLVIAYFADCIQLIEDCKNGDEDFDAEQEEWIGGVFQHEFLTEIKNHENMLREFEEAEDRDEGEEEQSEGDEDI